MAKLYEIQKKEAQPELTGSLARSFKESLILPVERRFNMLETEIAALGVQVEQNNSALNTRLDYLTRVFRVVTYLSLASLMGIIAVLVLLFSRH